ncbi:GH25 family lysozyme [Lacticaseibacillus nasuensis]|uniref:Prophage lp2 protein 56, lysin n=1 Tax=Lacticaseibacillus nasuensis JCM 17158 TaxID=1291734 RepID=A0A0R1JVW8_9LACO|nr:GH25 family lysozyme [Lacticaseibacillus nasuensis]KRK72644.1 prophage lp2 protein 56, lysin [Lacticaseibacillus nasuensis JCM 17158]
MTLNGIDVSSHNPLDLTKVPGDFAIIKATEGTSYTNPLMANHIKQAKAAGKLFGLYHYQTTADPVAEAKYFLSKSQPYVGQGILALDFEAAGLLNSAGPAKALKFLQYIQQQTGVRMFLYISLSPANTLNWSSVAKTYPLWVAQYNSMATVNGYQTRALNGTPKYWGKALLHQYTSAGRLAGYAGNLDLDRFDGDKALWAAWARGSVAAPAKPATSSPAKVATPAVTWHKETGTFTPDRAINLRTAASTSGKLIAVIKAGQQIKYDAFAYAGGYVWLRQPRSGGSFGYLASGNASGNKRLNYWGKFS